MLNDAMDEVVLVKGWKKGANWSFPRGKINKDEKDLDCAIREVYEETGFDIRAAGLVAKDEDVKFIEVTMREQHMRLYVFRGVPYDTYFEPRTRKEISKIQWYKLSELPTLKKNKNHQEGDGEDLAINANKFYMVAPFLVPLKKWIAQQSKRDVLKGSYENKLVPSTVPQASRTVETPVSEKITSEPPRTDDMGRLMAHLRQSGQDHGNGDLPGMPQLNGSREDAAAQLKSLLRLPQTESTPPPTVRKTATADDAKSNALLALLRGGNPNRQSHPVQPPPPHTPLEQISAAAPVPASPRHQPTQPPRFSGMPLPPSFPLSGPPARGPLDHSEQPAFSLNRHPDYPDSVSQQPLGISQSPTREMGRYPLTAPQPQRQQPVTSTTHGGGGYAAALSSAAQARHQAPAPYRRTGDPEFVRAPQNINNLPPSIPPASKLPAPKLTTHSSALLDIFRTGKASDQTTKIKPAGIPQSSAPATLPAGPSTLREAGINPASQAAADVSRHREGRKEVPRTATIPLTLPQRSNIDIPSASPLSLPYPSQGTEKNIRRSFEAGQVSNKSHSVDGQSGASVPRTQHQDALLDLFRKPSVSVANIPSTQSTTLEPPFAPIELSAMPSPSHSREPSRVSNRTPALSSQQTTSGQITLPKRPIAQQKRSMAPVSATVTGPLNLPHFEATSKRGKESKTVNGSFKKPGALSGVQASPMTILSRPTNAQTPAPQPQPILPAPAAKTSGMPAPVTSTAARTVAESKEASKPFQPQILRRPPQPQPPSQPLPYETTAGRLTPPPPQPLPTETVAGGSSSPTLPPPPHHRLSFDRRDSQPQEHKKALLSLFHKPFPVASPSMSAHTAVVSPLSDRTALGEHLASAFPEPSTSRIGSRTSMIGDGSVRLSSGRQTARTTPVDKTFLLGYLEGVAKGDRR